MWFTSPVSKRDAGVTLVEVMVAAAILALIIAAAARLLTSTSRAYNGEQARHIADQQFETYLRLFKKDVQSLQGAPTFVTNTGAVCTTPPCPGIVLNVPDPASGAGVVAGNWYTSSCHASPANSAVVDFDAAMPVRCLPACGAGQRPYMGIDRFPASAHKQHLVFPANGTFSDQQMSAAVMTCYSQVGNAIQVDSTMVILDSKLAPHLFRHQSVVPMGNTAGVNVVP